MDWFICNCMCITSTVYSLPGPVLPRHGFCWRSAESTGNTLSLPSSLHPSLTSYLHPSSCHSFIHRFILPSLSPIPHLSFHILSFLHSFTPIIPPVTSLSINSFLSNSFHYPSSLHPYSSPYLCFTPSLFFLTSDLILYFLILSLINWLSYSPSPSSLTHFLSLFPHSLPLTPSHSLSLLLSWMLYQRPASGIWVPWPSMTSRSRRTKWCWLPSGCLLTSGWPPGSRLNTRSVMIKRKMMVVMIIIHFIYLCTRLHKACHSSLSSFANWWEYGGGTCSCNLHHRVKLE